MSKKKICVLGWYGTETMGDRAILDGIFAIFSKTYGSCNFYIGSLFPVLTERTLRDDGEIFRRNAPDSSFALFDVKNELKKYMDKSDLIIMGGGPIMELDELYLILGAFKYAHKRGKKTAVLGCGYGPFKSKHLIGVSREILSNSDLVVFRDEKSLQYANELAGQKKEWFVLNDPAVISVLLYLVHKNNNSLRQHVQAGTLAMNFRELFPPYSDLMRETMLSSAHELIVQACKEYETVVLVPMHTFAIGYDDRCYFSKLTMDIACENLDVLNRPIDLYELYDVYCSADACVGMRYHSVVMQTLLNGNNYILDYTERGKGKISGFIDALPDKEFYKNRYTNIAEDLLDIKSCLDILKQNKHYVADSIKVESSMCDYVKLLSSL